MEKQRWEESEKRREEKKRENQRRERVRRKKTQVRKKVKLICSSGGSKSRLATAAGPEPSGQMRDENLHVVVARSTFGSQTGTKHTKVGPLSKVEMSKKCTPLWREAHFQVKFLQSTPASEHFWKLRCQKSARRCGAQHISKSKVLKTGGLRPLLDVKDAFRMAGGVQRDMVIRDVRRSGRCAPERGCILEYQIFRLAKMTLRDRCSTSYDLASIFVAGAVL